MGPESLRPHRARRGCCRGPLRTTSALPVAKRASGELTMARQMVCSTLIHSVNLKHSKIKKTDKTRILETIFKLKNSYFLSARILQAVE